jgi:hypothetical protein
MRFGGKMSEKSDKHKIEDVISTVLNGTALERALDLLAYFRENKISFQWTATNAWKSTYKGYSVCFVRLYGAAEYHKIQP